MKGLLCSHSNATILSRATVVYITFSAISVTPGKHHLVRYLCMLDLEARVDLLHAPIAGSVLGLRCFRA